MGSFSYDDESTDKTPYNTDSKPTATATEPTFEQTRNIVDMSLVRQISHAMQTIESLESTVKDLQFANKDKAVMLDKMTTENIQLRYKITELNAKADLDKERITLLKDQIAFYEKMLPQEPKSPVLESPPRPKARSLRSLKASYQPKEHDGTDTLSQDVTGDASQADYHSDVFDSADETKGYNAENEADTENKEEVESDAEIDPGTEPNPVKAESQKENQDDTTQKEVPQENDQDGKEK